MYIDPYSLAGTLKENQDQLYCQSDDPWDNKGTYIVQFEGLSNHIKELSDKSINLIDLGCGGGNALEGLIYHFSKITSDIKIGGVDISSKAIELLRGDSRFSSYQDADFQVGDLSDLKSLPYSDSRVNVYSMVDVLCSLEYDWESISKNIWNIVPVGSYVLVADCDVQENRKFKKLYNEYPDARIVVNHTTKYKVVKPKTKNWSSRFNWSIYQKVIK